ncbi:uncharacterized protein WM277_011547 [Molossus nigricans]
MVVVVVARLYMFVKTHQTGEEGGLFVSLGRSPLRDQESCKYGDAPGTFAASCIVPPPRQPGLLSRARPVTGRRQPRAARAPNPRAQVDSAGPRPALSAGPTPPRPPGRSRPRRRSRPAQGTNRRRAGRLPPERSELATRPRRRPGAAKETRGGERGGETLRTWRRRRRRRRNKEQEFTWANRRLNPGRPRPRWRGTIIRAGRGGGYGSSSVSSVRGTCRAGGRPAEKTNRCFFFLLLLLLPHRNTHKHPARGPSYRGGIAAGPGTNPPVGGGVPPCGLVSEQNADRKCSCRNDSLHRRQTLTTTPSSPLHFRHRRRRRRRRHFGSGPRPRRAVPPGSRAAGGCSGAAAPRLRALLRLRAAVDVAVCCRSCGAAFGLRRGRAGSPQSLFSWRPTGAGSGVGGGRARGGRCGPARLAGRARRPGGSSLALGSRARGGHAEDARDSTATVHFLNGIPAAWRMDVSYPFSPARPDFTPVSALFLRSKNATRT